MNTGTLTILPLFSELFPDPRAEPRSPQDWPHHHLGLCHFQHPVLPCVPACSEPPPDLLGTHFALYQDVLLCNQQALLPAERLREVR